MASCSSFNKNILISGVLHDTMTTDYFFKTLSDSHIF